jgi:hypothetical protein
VTLSLIAPYMASATFARLYRPREYRLIAIVAHVHSLF